MRFFILGLVCIVATVIGVAGFRGDKSRRPPIELFPDMDRQAKLRPQDQNAFFANGRSSQPHPANTVARGSHYEDKAEYSGRIPGTTNFVETIPLPVTATLMARGQERFNIYCSPCHGPQADGNGITKKIGAMGVVANLHDPRIVKLPDGEIFHIASNGRGQMLGYAGQIPSEDRWAIVSYLRALQVSKLGSETEVPAEFKAALKK